MANRTVARKFSEDVWKEFIKYQGDLQRRRGFKPSNDYTLLDLLKRTRYWKVEHKKITNKNNSKQGGSNE